MLLPCELTIRYLLPPIRRGIAKELERLGLSQREIAKLLGFTQPAVSHYLKDKRGGVLKLSKNGTDKVKALAREMYDGLERPLFLMRVCEICKHEMQDRILCDIHRSLEDVPETCDFCTRD
ncbi:MAG: XRE family transcriptional regulator [Candidatus Undinarchaeales archaeon]|jgi:hypothetical protein|nr:XRE family transcriptional regulator [Candidatus Undinarchaeales archaeon]MDP7493875.1 XRE family transcriptional regulator [Candidatus Undinarchaeales archaeon]